MSYYLAISALWIALGLASIATLLSGSVIRQRYKKADITPT